MTLYIWSSLAYSRLIFLFLCHVAHATITIDFNLEDLTLELGETAVLDIRLSNSTVRNGTLEFLYQEGERILPYQLKHVIGNLSRITLEPNNTKYNVTIVAKDVGELLIHINASSIEIVGEHSRSVYVRVVYSFEALILGKLCGWVYLVSWSSKQIPQIYLSWKTKSVQGVSLDFVMFNTIGNFAYMLYNILLYTISDIQKVYRAEHPLGLFPVELNDVVCICFMTFVSLIQVGQCFIYESGKQKISKLYAILLGVTVVFIAVMLILTLVDALLWLTFLTAASYLKVLSAPLKYAPQVLYNFLRQSTSGWSVYYSWMDLIGGSCSVFQMLINAKNEGDWSSLLGNFPKFSLGSIHILFDLVLLFQHFVLYKSDGPYEHLHGSQEKKEKTPPSREASEMETKSSSQETSNESTPFETSKIPK